MTVRTPCCTLKLYIRYSLNTFSTSNIFSRPIFPVLWVTEMKRGMYYYIVYIHTSKRKKSLSEKYFYVTTYTLADLIELQEEHIVLRAYIRLQLILLGFHACDHSKESNKHASSALYQHGYKITFRISIKYTSHLLQRFSWNIVVHS